jgi:hypothetical protein
LPAFAAFRGFVTDIGADLFGAFDNRDTAGGEIDISPL